MKPYNPGGHSAYQERILTQLRKHYPDAASSLPASTWEIMEKFWSLDLSELDLIMADRYSDFVPPPRLPSDMLRSILLSVEFKVTSYTKWAADLKENHLHAILSGFPVGDTSGVGTFYDFQSRLWMSDKDNLSDPVHPPSDGIPTGNAGISAMTYICSRPLIRKTTSPSFLSLALPPGMTPSASFITGSP